MTQHTTYGHVRPTNDREHARKRIEAGRREVAAECHMRARGAAQPPKKGGCR